MKTWRMANRNIFRNRRRSLVTTAAMTFALAIMVIYSGLIDGFTRDMERNATMLEMGHVQIHARGYRESPSIYKRIEAPEKLVGELKARGFRASYRLFANALAAKDKSSAGVQLRGVDPRLEAESLRLPKHMLAGKWLHGSDPQGVVLGRWLSRTLSAKIGDEIVIVSQASDGSMANDLYKVRGILKNVGESIDRAGFFMTAEAFRELMVVPKGAHQVVVTCPENTDIEKVAAEIASMADGNEVHAWWRINPALAEMISLTDAFLLPMIVLVYLAIAIVILNAMLMAVFERIKEYGVMKALGVTPGRVFALVSAETVIMTTIAALIGVGIGLPLAFLLEEHGLDVGYFSDNITMTGVAMETVWRADVSAKTVLMPLLTLYVLSLIASVYPALKAARLNPVDAMRHL